MNNLYVHSIFKLVLIQQMFEKNILRAAPESWIHFWSRITTAYIHPTHKTKSWFTWEVPLCYWHMLQKPFYTIMQCLILCHTPLLTCSVCVFQIYIPRKTYVMRFFHNSLQMEVVLYYTVLNYKNYLKIQMEMCPILWLIKVQASRKLFLSMHCT